MPYKTITRSQADEIMARHGWLSTEGADFRQEVLQRAQLIRVGARQIVYHFGGELGGLYGLVRGVIAVGASPPDSAPRLTMIGAIGNWTGEGCFLTGEPRRLELRTVSDCLLMHLPLHQMEEMAKNDPNAIRAFARLLMANVDELLHVIHVLQYADPARRIAAMLLRAGSRIGERPLALSQASIGEMSNTSRKQVNAALARFAEAGWLKHSYSAVTILDAARLHELAAGDV